MKKVLLLLLVAVSAFCSCDELKQEGPEKEPVVVLPDGAVLLEDTGFGMYYGDKNYDGVGVYSIVLSDARCYMDGLDNPYMDSEGDMLVLSLKDKVLPRDAAIELPSGKYTVSTSADSLAIDPVESYLVRFVGSTQSVWNIESGDITVQKGTDGIYTLTTDNLAIRKESQKDTVSYVSYGSLELDDYYVVAPAMLSKEDDIINLPFTDVECVYYGDLYGSKTGNFLINMFTKGFYEEIYESATGTYPGVYYTLNFFSELFAGNKTPRLNPGTYKVSAISSSELFSEGTLLPGIYMDGSPFGSYLLQQMTTGDYTIEYLTTGSVEVSYDTTYVDGIEQEYTTLNYSFGTSGRKVQGAWRGILPINNQAEQSGDSYLTTLEDDVECDMSKVTGGTLTLVEVLHRENVDEELDYDIAEAWQLYLQPRDWTPEEKNIPWSQDNNHNGISDRLDAWTPDGDCMIFEFVLPLGSNGVIAPELYKEYVYTMQPNLSLEDENYALYASKMGRPEDEIFDAKYAEQFPAWASALGIESYDRTSARRGFTWDGGFRGNWYMHYAEDQYFIMDGHAPAVSGTVKVVRTGEYLYNFEWELYDDNPGSANKITGKIENCVVGVRLP